LKTHNAKDNMDVYRVSHPWSGTHFFMSQTWWIEAWSSLLPT